MQELGARGEAVSYYATPQFESDIERTGSRYRGYSDPVVGALDPLAVPATDKLSWLLMRVTEEVLRHDRARIRADRPDYIVTDSVAPWGQWIGELLGLPVVTSITTFAVNRQVLSYAVRHGVKPTSAGAAMTKIAHITKAALLNRRLRREYGARGPGVFGTVMGRSALNIVYTSTYFQKRSRDGSRSWAPGSSSRRTRPALRRSARRCDACWPTADSATPRARSGSPSRRRAAPRVPRTTSSPTPEPGSGPSPGIRVRPSFSAGLP